ncbi:MULTISPECIES: sunset domain-containing protein [unclassified Arthrobacter]|uniref:sunset domain-containing protein n=1 Tax=unclassified Arthrobacter TaxID=235627 RepID=UPI002DFA92A8|nr:MULTISPECIES: hypothetical protein [unclassified Arthrobacter]MEC5192985.1 hypothetical protein [Arthrobacter sp. MP_M4]MEC5204507.1 hypothetical protein [Arthrobacter sp. MP_M7]
MDWIIWLVVIVAIVAIVWWLLNRNSSRRSSGSTRVGTASSGAASTSPREHDAGHAASHAEPESSAELEREPERISEPRRPAAAEPAPTAAATEDSTWSESPSAAPQAAASVPVHHREYTEPQAPTLPGAESAAAEAGPEAAAPDGRATPSAAPPALTEADSRHSALFLDTPHTAARPEAEPAGHLAAAQPYGEGSAAPAADGSGPDGFTVKGDAAAMVYHDETSSAFEETRAEVWFLSTAHAEAAGFRPPRRTRQ